MRMTLLLRIQACFLSLIAVCAIVSPAAGQQELRLDEGDEWVETREIDPSSPEGKLLAIRRLLAEDDAERALQEVELWIEQHEDDPMMPEAYLLRGDAKAAQGNYFDALFDYEYIARVYPGAEVFPLALQRELQIAKLYIGGLKRKIYGLRIWDSEPTAEELLIRIQERMPGSRLAEDAGMTLADFYFNRGDMSLAAEAYLLYIENYPDAERISRARRRLIYANLAAFKGPEYDPTGLYEARARLRELQAVEPTTAEQVGAEAILARIDESDAEKLLTTARWCLQRKDPISAEMYIRRLMRTYPQSVAATDALRMIPDILDDLPPAVLAETPDYATLRKAILGIDETSTNSAASDSTASESAAPAKPPAEGATR